MDGLGSAERRGKKRGGGGVRRTIKPKKTGVGRLFGGRKAREKKGTRLEKNDAGVIT